METSHPAWREHMDWRCPFNLTPDKWPRWYRCESMPPHKPHYFMVERPCSKSANKPANWCIEDFMMAKRTYDCMCGEIN